MRIATYLIVALIGCLAAAEGWGGAPAGREYTLKVDAPRYGLIRAQFELWIPATVVEGAPVRAVICNPKYQADTRIYEMEDWRALASRQRAAMLRHDMLMVTAEGRQRLPVGIDATQAIFDALAHFARESGRAELAGAPLVITGLSQGGAQTTRLAALVPERVVAAIPFHGAAFEAYTEGSPATKVPLLIPIGSMDDLVTSRVALQVPQLLAARPLAAVLVQPGIPHHTLGEQDFILMWLEEVMQLRIDDGAPGRLRPLGFDDGWLGQMSLSRRWLAENLRVQAAKEAPADQRWGSWLPSEKLARAWMMSSGTGVVAGHESREEIAATVSRAPRDLAIDGKLDEWGTLTHDMTYCAQILPNGLAWRGPGDCAARFSIAADEEHLYFAIRVDDDELRRPGKAPWSRDQDGVELRIDARPAHQRLANTGRGEGADFLVLGIGVGPGENEAFVANREKLPAGTKVAVISDSRGYSVEVAVPHRWLDEQQGQAWTRFRMNLCIDDNDKDGNSQLNWRPDWRSDMSEFGQGTVERRSATTPATGATTQAR